MLQKEIRTNTREKKCRKFKKVKVKITNNTIVCLHYSQIHSAAVVTLTHLEGKRREDGGKEEQEEEEEEEKKRSIGQSEFIKSESFLAHYSLH